MAPATRFSLAGLAGLALLAGLLRAADEPAPPAKGAALPGPFQAWTVNGTRPGKYHCPVCERGLLPGVLVLSKSIPAATDPLGQLLVGLEKLTVDRKDARVGASAIFLTLKDEIQLDEGRAPLLDKLQALAKDASLAQVTLGLARQDAPEATAYGMAGDEEVVVIYYDRLHVKDRFAAAKALTEEEVAEVLKKAEAMLPPKPAGKKKPTEAPKPEPTK
jgi:hypothetical protein